MANSGIRPCLKYCVRVIGSLRKIARTLTNSPIQLVLAGPREKSTFAQWTWVTSDRRLIRCGIMAGNAAGRPYIDITKRGLLGKINPVGLLPLSPQRPTDFCFRYYSGIISEHVSSRTPTPALRVAQTPAHAGSWYVYAIQHARARLNSQRFPSALQVWMVSQRRASCSCVAKLAVTRGTLDAQSLMLQQGTFAAVDPYHFAPSLSH